MQRQPEIINEHPGSTLIQYRDVNAIFRNSSIEETTAKERTLYVNEARRDDNPTIVTRPPTHAVGQFFFEKKTRIPCSSRTTMPL